MAQVVGPLAADADSVAAPQPGGRSQDRRIRPAVQGVRHTARQTVSA